MSQYDGFTLRELADHWINVNVAMMEMSPGERERMSTQDANQLGADILQLLDDVAELKMKFKLMEIRNNEHIND